MTWVDSFNNPSHPDFRGLPIIANDGQVLYSITSSAIPDFSPPPNTLSAVVFDHVASDSNMTTETEVESSAAFSDTSTDPMTMNDSHPTPTLLAENAPTLSDCQGFSSCLDSDAFVTLLLSSFSAEIVIAETTEVARIDDTNILSDGAKGGTQLSEAFGSTEDRLSSTQSPPPSPYPGSIVQKHGTTPASSGLTRLEFTSKNGLPSTRVNSRNGEPVSMPISVLTPAPTPTSTPTSTIPLLISLPTLHQTQTPASIPTSETTTPTLGRLAAGKCPYQSGYGAAWTFWQKSQYRDSVALEQHRLSDDDVEYDPEGFSYLEDYSYDSDGNAVNDGDDEDSNIDDSDDNVEDCTEPDSMTIPLHEDILHVTSMEIRRQINELYQLPSGASSSQHQSPVPDNVQELVDILIRRFLPRFWSDRTRDPELNQNRNRPCENKRPHAHAILSTCVECDFRFHKQLIYDGPAIERQIERDTRARSKTIATPDFDETTAMKATPRRRKRAPAIKREDRLSPGSAKTPVSSFPSDFSTATVDIQVLNRNRGRSDYDGNLDHVGTKENDHLGLDCPLNRTGLISDTIRPASSKRVRSKATKLHVGWNVVPGHDFSSLIDPLTKFRYGDTGQRATDASNQPTLEAFTSYYPARSLMASFVHILPRDVQLTTNQIRKLFAYFVWHPWFDSDLQAITFRASYHELWALFLVLDEGPDPSADTARNHINSTQGFVSKIRKPRVQDRKRRYHQDDHGIKVQERQQQQHKGVNKGGATMTYDKDQDERDAEADKEYNVSIESRGTDGHLKKRGRTSRYHSDIQIKPRDHERQEDKASKTDTSTQLPHNGPESSVRAELARLKSMEQRFMTYFESSLRVHNVYIHRRPRTSVEIIRQQYNVQNSWVLGGRELATLTSTTLAINAAKTSRKTGLYVVTDPILRPQPSPSLSSSDIIADGLRQDANGIHLLTPWQIHQEQIRLSQLPALTSSHLLTHNELTQVTDFPQDALTRIHEKVVQMWVHRAEKARQRFRFVMPRYLLESTKKTRG